MALTMTEETNPAAGPPFERTVRPCSWRREWNGDVSDLGTYVHADSEDELDGDGPWQPLYDQEALDAAVAAERERLALMAESQEDDAGFHSLSADEIRRGRLGNEGMG